MIVRPMHNSLMVKQSGTHLVFSNDLIWQGVDFAIQQSTWELNFRVFLYHLLLSFFITWLVYKPKGLFILAVSSLIALNNFERKNGTSVLKFALYIEIRSVMSALNWCGCCMLLLSLHLCKDTLKSTYRVRNCICTLSWIFPNHPLFLHK